MYRHGSADRKVFVSICSFRFFVPKKVLSGDLFDVESWAVDQRRKRVGLLDREHLNRNLHTDRCGKFEIFQFGFVIIFQTTTEKQFMVSECFCSGSLNVVIYTKYVK